MTFSRLRNFEADSWILLRRDMRSTDSFYRAAMTDHDIMENESELDLTFYDEMAGLRLRSKLLVGATMRITKGNPYDEQ